MVTKADFCLRCFKYRHQRQECKDPKMKIISCSYCYAMNYLTRDCCGRSIVLDDDEYQQSFRMVNKDKLRFFIDVPIGKKMVAAIISTNLSTSRMDSAVVHYLKRNSSYKYDVTNNTIQLEIINNRRKVGVNFEITDLENDDRLMLGMDYLLHCDVTLKLDGAALVPSLNGRFIKSADARYTIQVQIYHMNIEAIIDLSLTQSVISNPLAKNFLLINIDELDFFHANSVVPVTFNNITTEVNLGRLETPIKHQLLILETDFLKARDCIISLNGVELDVQNIWTTSHQDGIEYIYNHQEGTKLFNLLAIERFYKLRNSRRAILPKISTSPKEKVD